MRLKVNLISEKKFKVPYSYNYQLQSAIYRIIGQSEAKFAEFLHDVGFFASKDAADHCSKIFKFFTFSQLNFQDYSMSASGFENLSQTSFYFSTSMDKIYENFVLGLFAGKEMVLKFPRNHVQLIIEKATVLEGIEFQEKMRFKCLSPISASTVIEIDSKSQQHFLDYMSPHEREHFKINIYKNLCHKYEVLNGERWSKPLFFDFSFDPNYIAQKNGKISKLISFKNNIKIKCFEAPFTIKTYPELIKIGYECGFGDRNSAGLGCVEVL